MKKSFEESMAEYADNQQRRKENYDMWNKLYYLAIGLVLGFLIGWSMF